MLFISHPLNNPAGIIRSVENTNGVPLWHVIHPFLPPGCTYLQKMITFTRFFLTAGPQAKWKYG
jgi:hypothetical protein